jgi:hypothetical protein
VSAIGIPEVSGSSLGAAARSGIVVPARRLGAAEALVVLVVIDAVVGLFVGLQVAYLFGGQNTIVAAGMTYSDYARRGFFELVAAACLAGAVAVVLEATVARRSRPYLAALLGLLALTAVVLVSAALRLRLYQDAYGWTELRLYVLTAIVSLAAALMLMTVLALAGRMNWLGHGLAVIGVLALVALNLIAPAGFVAARNVERVIDPALVAPGGHAGLDADYLGVLPDDAATVGWRAGGPCRDSRAESHGFGVVFPRAAGWEAHRLVPQRGCSPELALSGVLPALSALRAFACITNCRGLAHAGRLDAPTAGMALQVCGDSVWHRYRRRRLRRRGAAG